jgi:hypothetical protein
MIVERVTDTLIMATIIVIIISGNGFMAPARAGGVRAGLPQKGLAYNPGEGLGSASKLKYTQVGGEGLPKLYSSPLADGVLRWVYCSS